MGVTVMGFAEDFGLFQLSFKKQKWNNRSLHFLNLISKELTKSISSVKIHG